MATEVVSAFIELAAAASAVITLSTRVRLADGADAACVSVSAVLASATIVAYASTYVASAFIALSAAASPAIALSTRLAAACTSVRQPECVPLLLPAPV